jgi:hypothetical protein
MKMTFTALVAAAALAAAIGVSLAAGSVSVVGAMVVDTTVNEHPGYVATPAPGYVLYRGHDGALPSASCFWTRMPVYDNDHNVIGWRGRPVAVCPQPRMSAQAQ